MFLSRPNGSRISLPGGSPLVSFFGACQDPGIKEEHLLPEKYSHFQPSVLDSMFLSWRCETDSALKPSVIEQLLLKWSEKNSSAPINGFSTGVVEIKIKKGEKFFRNLASSGPA